MEAIAKLDSKLMKIIDILIIVLMFSLVAMVFFQVINRFILHIPAAWTEEMARYNFVWASLYGSIKALKMKCHLSVDILVETRKSERTKNMINLVASLFIMAFTVILTVTGYQYMMANMGVGCEFGPFPLAIIYSAVPITGVMMFFISIGQMCEQIKLVRGDY